MTRDELKFIIYESIIEEQYESLLCEDNKDEIIKASVGNKDYIKVLKMLKSKEIKDELYNDINSRMNSIVSSKTDAKFKEFLDIRSELKQKFRNASTDSEKQKIKDEMTKALNNYTSYLDSEELVDQCVKELDVTDIVNDKYKKYQSEYGFKAKMNIVKNKFISADPKYKAIAITLSALVIFTTSIIIIKVVKNIKDKKKKEIEEESKLD